jgi:hypothetical protein
MVKKNSLSQGLLLLALLVLSSTLASSPLFAQTYGQDILSAGTNLYTWLRRLGAITTMIGLGWGGIKITFQHDTQHLKGPLFTCLGGIICLLAPSIVNVLLGMAGGSAATLNQ